jgi:hypothetical protein
MLRAAALRFPEELDVGLQTSLSSGVQGAGALVGDLPSSWRAGMEPVITWLCGVLPAAPRHVAGPGGEGAAGRAESLSLSLALVHASAPVRVSGMQRLLELAKGLAAGDTAMGCVRDHAVCGVWCVVCGV